MDTEECTFRPIACEEPPGSWGAAGRWLAAADAGGHLVDGDAQLLRDHLPVGAGPAQLHDLIRKGCGLSLGDMRRAGESVDHGDLAKAQRPGVAPGAQS